MSTNISLVVYSVWVGKDTCVWCVVMVGVWYIQCVYVCVCVVLLVRVGARLYSVYVCDIYNVYIMCMVYMYDVYSVYSL